MNVKNIAITLIAALLLTACAGTGTSPTGPGRSALTQGTVEIVLEKNVTNQQEVLDAFGSPNVIRKNAEGEDVWTYQQYAASSASSSSGEFLTILVAGASARNNYFERSRRTMTLILTFKNGVLVGFESLSTQF